MITAASTGTNFTFYAVVANSTGGSWLTINPSSYGYGITTPQAITVGVNPAPLPQLINVTSTGTTFNFIASVANSTGGNWHSINPSSYGYGLPTPQQLMSR